MLAKHLAHALTFEWRPAGQRLEQHGAGGVQVGPLVRILVEQARLLRRHVPSRTDRVIANRSVETSAARQAKIDKRGAHWSAFVVVVQNDVGGFQVAMQHTMIVYFPERR